MRIKANLIGLKNTKIALKRELEKLTGGNTGVLIGYPDDGNVEKDGTLVATVAAYNQFGTDNAPARPFLDVGVEKAADDSIKIMSKGIDDVLSGKTDMDAVLGLVGNICASSVKQYITDLKVPPNSPETIRRKKTSNPLIETSTMKNSTTYELTRSVVADGVSSK